MVATQAQVQQWLDMFETQNVQLHAAIKAALPMVTSGHPAIAAVGLLSDIDAATLVPIAETADHLAENQGRRPDLALWHPWATDEWALHPGNTATPLDAVVGTFADLARSVPEDDFIEYTDAVWTGAVDQRAALVRDGWFAEHYPGAVVAFGVTDLDLPDETAIEWVEELNPDGRGQRCIEWLRATPG